MNPPPAPDAAGRPRPLVTVACALLFDAAGRVLLARRPPHKHLGDLWEFPGGKVEPGESPAAALVREIREELGTEIDVGEALPPVTHAYPGATIDLRPFRCRLAAGAPEPHPHEHTALAWVTRGELAAYELCPADVPIVAALHPLP